MAKAKAKKNENFVSWHLYEDSGLDWNANWIKSIKMSLQGAMRKQLFDNIQPSLQGTGIAALGALSIYEPKMETVLFWGNALIAWPWCRLLIRTNPSISIPKRKKMYKNYIIFSCDYIIFI